MLGEKEFSNFINEENKRLHYLYTRQEDDKRKPKYKNKIRIE